MKLTPLDIRKHDFTKGFRGYDPDEVQAFLDTVSQQWEEVLDDLRRAEDRVREIENKISHYEKVEMALQEALESARAGAKRAQDNADERASLIVEEAELKAEQIVQDAEQDRFRLQQDVVTLTHRHNEVTARLRHFLMSELEILARHENDQPIGFMKLMPATPAEALPPTREAQRPASSESVGPSPSASAPAAAPSAQAASDAADDEAEAEALATEAPASTAPEDTSEENTTYADLYARAAEAERERPAPDEPEPDEEAESDDEPAWTLRSIVTGLDENSEADAEGASTDKDRIRRILDDLD